MTAGTILVFNASGLSYQCQLEGRGALLVVDRADRGLMEATVFRSSRYGPFLFFVLRTRSITVRLLEANVLNCQMTCTPFFLFLTVFLLVLIFHYECRCAHAQTITVCNATLAATAPDLRLRLQSGLFQGN